MRKEARARFIWHSEKAAACYSMLQYTQLAPSYATYTEKPFSCMEDGSFDNKLLAIGNSSPFMKKMVSS